MISNCPFKNQFFREKIFPCVKKLEGNFRLAARESWLLLTHLQVVATSFDAVQYGLVFLLSFVQEIEQFLGI